MTSNRGLLIPPFYQIDSGSIYHGDCLDVMREMPDESIDMVITSPPYDSIRTYNNNIDKTWNFEQFKAIADELYRLLKQGGVIVWVVNDTTINGSETGTSFKQALYFKEIGLNLHDTMIWHKISNRWPGRTRYGPVFEYMFVLSKGRPKTANILKDRPCKSFGRKKSPVGDRLKDGSMDYKGHLKAPTRVAEYSSRFNVWDIPPCTSSKERTGHPAQFPVRLVRDHLFSWTVEGDTVLDPFMGSGTTAEACILTGRKFIGIELSEEYCEIIRHRLDNMVK